MPHDEAGRYVAYTREQSRVENEYRVFRNLDHAGTCTVCGALFRSRLERARYCSQRCRNDAATAARNASTTAHTAAVCQCGKRIELQAHKGRRPRYCSPACRQRAYRQRRKTALSC